MVFGNCTRINHTRKYMKSSDGESVSNNFRKILFLKKVKSLSSLQHLEKYFAGPIFGGGRPLTKYLVNASPPSTLKPRQLAIRSFGMFTIRKSLLGQLRMARMRQLIFGLRQTTPPKKIIITFSSLKGVTSLKGREEYPGACVVEGFQNLHCPSHRTFNIMKN